MATETPGTGFPEKTAKAVQPLIKLVTLANAGGVAATVTVIGATAKNGNFYNALAAPLGLFSIGVCFSILYSLALFLRIAKFENFEPSPPKFAMADRFLRFNGHGAIVAFIAGCVSGVLIIAIT